MPHPRVAITVRTAITVLAVGCATLSGCSRSGAQSGSTAAAIPTVYGEGTQIAGISVAGMTRQQAEHTMQAALASRSSTKVSLGYLHRSFPRTWKELGVTPDISAMLQRAWSEPDVPLMCQVDMGAAKRSIRRAALALDIRPIPPRFTDGPGSSVKPGKSGRRVDIYATALAAKFRIENNPKAALLDIVVTPDEPEFTAAELASVTTRLVQFSTRYNPGARDRTHNLRLVAQRLDGALVPPGKIFSFNDWVGERKESDGFREAIVYKDGKMVKDTGGGLCQVSSTLYNVALLAGLPIVERSKHSLTVTYVPLGRDATIYWGQHDLRFRNDTGMPLYIRAVPGGGRLTVEAWGSHPLDREVKVTSSSSRRNGKAVASVYRTIAEGGTERTERLSTDTYSMEHTMASTPRG